MDSTPAKKICLIISATIILSPIISAGSYSNKVGSDETKRKAWSSDWNGCTTAKVSCKADEYLIGEESKGTTGEYSDYQCRPQWYKDFQGSNSCTSNTRNDDWLGLSQERSMENGELGGSISKEQCGAESSGGPEVKAGVSALCKHITSTEGPPEINSISKYHQNGNYDKCERSLDINVTDPDGSIMNVTLYWENDTKITKFEDVAPNEKVSTKLSNLQNGKSYRWYAHIEDRMGQTTTSDQKEFIHSVCKTRKESSSDWNGCTTASVSCNSNEGLVGEERWGETCESDNSGCPSGDYGTYLNVKKERKMSSSQIGGTVSNQQCGAESSGGPEAFSTVSALCQREKIHNISDAKPAEGEVESSTSVKISADIANYNSSVFNISFLDSEGTIIDKINSVSNNSKVESNWDNLEMCESYSWRIQIHEGIDIETKSWDFKTQCDPGNNAPVINSNSPENINKDNTSGVTLEAEIGDADNDQMNLTFYNASDDSQIGRKENINNGTYTTTWNNLDSDKTYEYYIELTDGTDTTTSSTFNFTTIDIDLTWNDNSDNENGFEIYQNSTGSYQKVADLGKDSTSYRDTNKNLESGKYTCYKVKAYNNFGESNPAEGCLTP